MQAYTCVSNGARRRAFDLERRKNSCFECNRIPYTTCSTPRKSNASKTSRCKNLTSRLQGLKGIRERFKEEAKVIENCLRANATSREESPLFNPSDGLFPSSNRTRKESPVFNPSDYTFQGYPHLRTRICKKPENYWFLQSGRGYDTPIFEVGSETAMLRSKSACVRS